MKEFSVLQKPADKTSSKEALFKRAQEVEIALTSWALTCILFRSSLEHDELQDVDEDDRKEEGFLLLKGTVCNNAFLFDSANMQPLWCCPMQEQETCSAEGTGNETVQEELPSFLGNFHNC